MNKTTISAVIPTHNRAALLSQAIHSVLRQTRPVDEIIVVDDNSQDHTAQIVAEVKHPGLKYVRHETSRGGSAARNTGIDAATSEFIAFLDDDDEWHADKTERQVSVNLNYDAVLCGTTKRSGVRRWVELKDHLIRPDELKRGFVFPGGTSNLMARTQVMREHRFDETLPSGQDWDILIRLSRACRVAYLSAPLVTYNDGDHPRMGNAAANLTVEGLLQRAKIVDKHRAFLGPYWSRYHIASYLLSNFRARDDKLMHALYTVRKCGLAPTLPVLLGKVARQLR